MYVGLHGKYLLFLYCNETQIYSTDFQKILKFQISVPSSGSRVVPCRQTNMKKLIVAFFCSFANALNNWCRATIQLCCNAWSPLSEYEYLYVSGWKYRLQYSIMTLKTTVWLRLSYAMEVHWNLCPSFLKGLWKKAIIVGKWQLWEKF